jgi:hypothetical protein
MALAGLEYTDPSYRRIGGGDDKHNSSHIDHRQTAADEGKF